MNLKPIIKVNGILINFGLTMMVIGLLLNIVFWIIVPQTMLVYILAVIPIIGITFLVAGIMLSKAIKQTFNTSYSDTPVG